MDTKKQSEKDYILLQFINKLIINAAIGFNLYWLIFEGGRYLNDVISLMGFQSSIIITLPLTVINLLFVKDINIRILSYINAILLIILVSFAFKDPGNYDWQCFFMRSSFTSVIISLIMILPFAIIPFSLSFLFKALRERNDKNN